MAVYFGIRIYLGAIITKKSPAKDAGQRRASSIHERLPDKPASAGTPVLGSIDYILNTSSESHFRLKTFFHIEYVFILRPFTMRLSG
jgi:hypothetical protein